MHAGRPSARKATEKGNILGWGWASMVQVLGLAWLAATYTRGVCGYGAESHMFDVCAWAGSS